MTASKGAPREHGGSTGQHEWEQREHIRSTEEHQRAGENTAQRSLEWLPEAYNSGVKVSATGPAMGLPLQTHVNTKPLKRVKELQN